MKIRKIELIDYKRFKNLTIDLGSNPKKVIALVGPNGCGKSSVLDAMIFINNQYISVGNTATKGIEYHRRSMERTFEATQNVKIEFDDGDDFIQKYNLRNNQGANNTIFSFRSPYRYNSNLKIKSITSLTDIKLNSYGANSLSDLDNKMDESYQRLQAQFESYLWDNEDTATVKTTKEKFIGDLNNSIKECLDLEIVNLGNVRDNKGSLYFKKSDQQDPFEFNVLSSGEKEVVDILLDLYLRREYYNDTIYIIDEPELHINTSIQRKLLLEINKLIGDSCQLWIATHSVGFIRALQEELKDDCQIIKFDNVVNWSTEETYLEPMTPSRNNFRELFATALDDLANLIVPKKIIYCEGKDISRSREEEGLDAIIYNAIFNEEFNDTLFVSAGGNSDLGRRREIILNIIGKTLSETEVLILKDRDMNSGEFVSIEERNRFLEEEEDYVRILKRWEIENYLFDKDVVKKYCDSKGYTFNNEIYKSIITNIYDQDVKNKTNDIKRSCGLNENSISNEAFKKELALYIKPNLPIYDELKNEIMNRI